MKPETKAKRDALKQEKLARQNAELEEVIAFWNNDLAKREHLQKIMDAGLWEATFNPPPVEVCPDCGRIGCQLGYVKGHPVRGLPGRFCEFSIGMITMQHGPKAAGSFPLTVEEYMRPIIDRRENEAKRQAEIAESKAKKKAT